jgi:hypothetical protein
LGGSRTLGPQWWRVVALFVGAFATAGIPFLVAAASGVDEPEILLPVVGVYSILWLVAIFKVGTWSAQIVPPQGLLPVSLEVVRQRLCALNDLNLPFAIREDKKGRLIAEWRLADARWTGLMESGRLLIAHSVLMRIDERRRQVRATDLQKRITWRGGIGRSGWFGSWSFFRGIVFVQYEAAAEYGLLFKDGRWQLTQAYTYRFEVNEIKQPLVQAVVSSGWTWQPVVFR